MDGMISAEGLMLRSEKLFKKNKWLKKEAHLSNVDLRKLVREELKEGNRTDEGQVETSEHRLQGIGNLETAMVEMCDGSIGAMFFLQHLQAIELREFYMLLRMLDDAGIYGEDLYQLWNDCCNRSASRGAACIRLYMKGIMTAEKLLEKIRNKDIIDPVYEIAKNEAEKSVNARHGGTKQMEETNGEQEE